MAAELSSERHRLAALHLTEDLSVRAAFDVSYQALPDGTARAYRLLALVPGPDFGPGLAAAALAVPVGQGSRLLEALAEASLLEEIGAERFRFHDLVRLYAAERAHADEPTEEIAATFARVHDAFASKHIAYLIADWTRRDPAITALLSSHGRSGVPLYLYYAPGAANPKVLPQILTEGEVLAALALWR